jgi:hypothetical protein
MIAKHLFEAPPSPRALNPDVDPELDHLVTALLAKDVEARPTLEEARKLLRAAQRRIHQRTALHEGGHTDPVVDISGLPSRDPLALSMPIEPPPSATAFHRAETRERKLFVIGGAVVALAVLIVGGVLLFGKGSKTAAPAAPASEAAAPAPAAAPVAAPVAAPAAAPSVTPSPAPAAAATTNEAPAPIKKTTAKAATTKSTVKTKTTTKTTKTTTKPADDPDAPM